MEVTSKATRIRLFDLSIPQMRALHMTWFAFFLCFFAWFGIAPLMRIVREELALTQAQVGNLVIGSVAITVVARLLIGWLCDRIGPRLSYTWLLVVGSLPVMGIGLAQDYQTFLVFRVLIGVIGASFVITQHHTSVMFAPNVIGTANATTAGWGNLGGGVTQLIMPIVLGILTVGAYIPFTDIQFLPGLGLSDAIGWRVAMVMAGAMCALVGCAYYLLTQDAPEGNYSELRASGNLPPQQSVQGSFAAAAKDRRVWVLFVIYGACFGIELTLNNVLALDFVRYANILQGNYAGALDAAERNAPDADNDQSVIFNAQERVVHIWVVDKIFGKWDKLLTMEQTHTGTPYLDGMWSYVTGSALAATGDLAGAEEALAHIRRQADDETADSTGVGQTPASHLLNLAGFALEGEIKETRGDLEGAVQAYDQAVRTQDANNYTEPPDWSQSMRLYLGTALLSTNRWEDAETVFRQDLEWNQQSGWATYGLYHALTGQGRAMRRRLSNGSSSLIGATPT